MKLPAYLRTQPSGVDWLGDVPEHWDTLALKRRFHIVNGGTPSSSEETYWEGAIPWFTPEDLGRIETKLISKSRRQITEDGLYNCGARLSPKGSVLVSTRAPIGHVAVMGVDGCCNQGCRILTPDGAEVSADFGFYVVIASNTVLNSVGKGTTFLELSAGALGAHFFPLPDPAEQRAIAAFLDRETGRLDQLIAKKRELIERLKEKRTALISRTVTRGLPSAAARAAGLPENPSVKPTTLDWLGEIPTHWYAEPLKRAVNFVEGPGIMAAEFTDDGVPLLRISCIGGRTASLNDCNYVSRKLAATRWAHFRVKLHDLLISGSASTGFCSEVGDETVGAIPYTGIIIIRPIAGKVDRNFIRWFFLADLFLDQAALAKTGSTIQHFGPTHLSKMFIVVPPLPEQAALATYLDEKTAKLDALMGTVAEAVERLQEYRIALITAAVTGKIDVRGDVAT